MTVFITEDLSEAIRGMLTRYMYQVTPSVYVNTLSKTQRDTLVNFITENEISVNLLVAYDYAGQVEFEVYGNPKRHISDFDGVKLISRTIEKNKIYLSVNAKPSKSLLDHMLETGWTAEALMKDGMYRAGVTSLARTLNVNDVDVLIMNICHVVALHDIGKAHPDFQKNLKANNLTLLSQAGLLDNSRVKMIRHEQYSRDIVRNWIKKFYEAKDEQEDMSVFYAKAVLYHHQRKSQTDYRDLHKDNEPAWLKKVINPLLEIIEEQFPFTPIDLTGHVDAFFHFLSGVMMTADRIASSGLYEGIGLEK